MGFHEVRFPASLSFGSLGGPERLTDIVTLANGFEERNTPWAQVFRGAARSAFRISLEGLDRFQIWPGQSCAGLPGSGDWCGG